MNRPIRTALAVTAGLMLLVLPSRPAHAEEYKYTKLLDSSEGFDPVEVGCPAINDRGAVAIRAGFDSGETVIFRTRGVRRTVIASSVRDGFDFMGRNPSINDAGQVSFAATVLPTGERILRGQGGPLTTIAQTEPGPFNFFGFDTSLNDRGHVAFKAELDSFDQGLFVGREGPVRTVYLASTSPFAGENSGPSINDRGQVAFNEFLDDFEFGVFLASGRAFITLADSTGLVDPSGLPSLNAHGVVAFQGFFESGTGLEEGIFTGSGGPLTTVADSTGPFGSFGFGQLSLNDRGLVAFTASLDSGPQGLFVGPDPVADRVLLTGDELDGSTVLNVAFCREGLNRRGELAFQAQLEDGRTVVFRASPRRPRS